MDVSCFCCFPFLFYSCSFPTLLLFPSIYSQTIWVVSQILFCSINVWMCLVIIFNYFNTIQGINSRNAAYKWKLYKNNLSAHTCKRTNYHVNELDVSQLCADGGIAFHHAIWFEKNGNWTGFWSARVATGVPQISRHVPSLISALAKTDSKVIIIHPDRCLIVWSWTHGRSDA